MEEPMALGNMGIQNCSFKFY